MIIENDLDEFGKLERVYFSYLLEFNYRRQDGFLTMSDWSPDVRIKLLDTRPNAYNVLELTASNVSDLKIPNNFSSAQSIILGIEDMKSRQLSELNYYIRDVGDDDCFSFMCRDFKIQINKWELD